MKITCDIIKDLIPSYVDEICSEDSKTLIREHIKQCKACKEYYNSIIGTEFVGEVMNEKQIDYLKKIQHSYIYSIVIPLLFFAAAMIVRGKIDYRGICGIIFLMLLVSTVLQCKTDKREKQSPILWIITIIPIIYCAAFLLLLIQAAKKEISLFGIFPERFGPFMDTQLILGMTIELFIFCIIRFQSTTKQITSTANLICSIVFAGMLLAWDSLLYHMTDTEQLIKIFAEVSIIIFLMGILGISICKKIKKRKS